MGVDTKRGSSKLFAHLNTVELVKACPSPGLSQTFEELTHGLVVQAIRAVKHHTLQTNPWLVVLTKTQFKELFLCLKTGTCLAKAFARSLVVSVFPVPAGPSGAPPKVNFKAPIRVLVQHKIIGSRDSFKTDRRNVGI